MECGGVVDIDDVSRSLLRLKGCRGGGDTERAVQPAITFVEQNLDPALSPSLVKVAPDDMVPLAKCLEAPEVTSQRHVVHIILTVLRLLSRKQVNREDLHPLVAKAVVGSLGEATRLLDWKSAEEASQTIMNLGSSRVASSMLIAAVHPLTRCLQAPSERVRTAAAGALQAVCMHSEGKRAAVESEAIPLLTMMLEDDSAPLVARAAGALHNIVAHHSAARPMREHRGIHRIITLLQHPLAEVRRCAAGALQSLSRDKDCLEVINASGATGPLTELLAEDDMMTQVAAVGALLNIHGACDEASEQREELKRILSLLIFSSAIRDAFAPDDDTPPALLRPRSQAAPSPFTAVFGSDT
eukprot:Sspe_Gene.99594::Locus_73271_Transcript_1_1_Confidence_1.000_Length_1214::g.99594::m.99594